ncbi:aldolase/citrate lyase family protein [Oceanisphaera psychrotolerans]|nr:aldolase/citrate lyase family protein [Oceanisphaera psychrotolerans]
MNKHVITPLMDRQLELMAQAASWLFLPGHLPQRLEQAQACGAHALVVDLEEFTPKDQQRQACQAFYDFADACRARHRLPMVRINRLEDSGAHELKLLMAARPAAVFLPRVEQPAQLQALAALLDACEAELDMTPGSTVIVPTLESRTGLERAGELLVVSPRLRAALIGTGDLATDLQLPPEMPFETRIETIRPYRERFLADCQAAGVQAIDGPWSAPLPFEQDQNWSVALGFRARCVVNTEQLPALHLSLNNKQKDSSDSHHTPERNNP